MPDVLLPESSTVPPPVVVVARFVRLSVLNCACVVWNQVDTVTPVSIVKLREDDQLLQALVPALSFARTRHQ